MELPHLGKHCHFDECHQLDFLPFVCNACKETFCLTHKKREDHQCPVPDAEDNVRVPERSTDGQTESTITTYSCSIEGCEKRELAQISCHHCDRFFCLNHRLQEDHHCPKLPEKKPEVSKTAQHVQNILAKKEVKVKAKLTNPKAIQMAAKVNLMKMKRKAEGDAGIPQSERVYFTVVPPLDSGKQPSPLFFSKVWAVGRVIDNISDRLAIPNTNNTDSPQKLRLFHGDTGVLLETDQRLGDIMDIEENLLLTGGCLILERVGVNVSVLEGVERYSR